jgi:hypothetical protein
MMCGSILDSQFAGHLGRLALADIVIIIKNRPFYGIITPSRRRGNHEFERMLTKNVTVLCGIYGHRDSLLRKHNTSVSIRVDLPTTQAALNSDAFCRLVNHGDNCTSTPYQSPSSCEISYSYR